MSKANEMAADSVRSTLLLLDQYRRAIAQNLRNPWGNLGRVVTHADHGVCAQGTAVRQHLVEGIVSGPFAETRIKRDISPEQTLNARPDIADDRARPNDDAADDTERFDDSITRQLESGRCQRMCVFHTLNVNALRIEHHSLPEKKLIFTEMKAGFPSIVLKLLQLVSRTNGCTD